MGYPIAVLKRWMTHREFAEWCWAFDAEPFDDQRCHDLPAALQISHLLNLHLKDGADPFTPLEFMPFMKTSPPANDDDIDRAVIGTL